MNPDLLLQAWGGGNQRALDQLVPLVQQELQKLARRQMSRERPCHPLQTTALVNEVFERLIDGKQVEWQNRRTSSRSPREAYLQRDLASWALARAAALRVEPKDRVAAPQAGFNDLVNEKRNRRH